MVHHQLHDNKFQTQLAINCLLYLALRAKYIAMVDIV